jgi:hypothetical protein
MDYYYIFFLAIAAYFSIKGEKDPKRKKQFIAIYLFLIALALLYLSGQTIGQFIYDLTN